MFAVAAASVITAAATSRHLLGAYYVLGIDCA